MDRRSLLSGAAALHTAALFGQKATPTSTNTHEFSGLREASMFYRSVQYDVATDMESEPFALHSWACGFIAHPASRSTYRQFPNLFEDGEVAFRLPGLPDFEAEFIERSAEIFGEDATLCSLTNIEESGGYGAFIICLNGALVQMLCLEPTKVLARDESVESIRSIAKSIQIRDPEFYGRGELNRRIVLDHVALLEDVQAAYPHVRVKEDHYVFKQDDGISDFWE